MLVCAYPQRGEERRVSNLATPRFLGSSKEINGWTFFLFFFFLVLLVALLYTPSPRAIPTKVL